MFESGSQEPIPGKDVPGFLIKSSAPNRILVAVFRVTNEAAVSGEALVLAHLLESA